MSSIIITCRFDIICKMSNENEPKRYSRRDFLRGNFIDNQAFQDSTEAVQKISGLSAVIFAVFGGVNRLSAEIDHPVKTEEERLAHDQHSAYLREESKRWLGLAEVAAKVVVVSTILRHSNKIGETDNNEDNILTNKLL